MIEVGVDDDGNGALDSAEVDHVQYVCNGADGQDGQDGANGSASPNTMLTSISALTLQACSSGGRIMQAGLDNGDGGGTAQNGVLESGEVDYTTTYCSNFVLTRMADINSGGDTSQSGYNTGFTVMGTRLYFDAYDGSSGKLWAHETINSSTWQVADIYPGYYAGLTVMGTRLYFDAWGSSSGRELWAHETTNGSTWQVADINSSSSGSSSPGMYARVTVMGTRLYFDADDGSSGRELWAHETTNGSTWQVADINNGGGSSYDSGAGLTVMGTRLYFDADDGSSGRELWAHETTNSSTWQVADINVGSSRGGSSSPGVQSGLTVMGTRLYFDAYSSSSGGELWAHETTNSSTWQVADIVSGSSGSYPGSVTAMGTRLYFDASSSSGGGELWAHETTNGSTWQVADINSGGSSSNPGHYTGLTVMGTRLYFGAYDGSSGWELWAHETTNGSTWQVADINSGSSSSYPGYYARVTVMGTRLYFDANDGSSGYELWRMEIEHTITYN